VSNAFAWNFGHADCINPIHIEIASVQLSDAPSKVAEMVAVVLLDATEVATENVADVAPAGTVIVDGTVANVEPLASRT
jgi:hypothetical protein